MLVLHAHWQPPRRQGDAGGILFWAETTDAPQPKSLRGRTPRKFVIRDHPFCLPPDTLQTLIAAGTPLATASVDSVRLRLPTTGYGPLPSPQLNHNWELEYRKLFLATWLVRGLWLPSGKAFTVLANLPEQTHLFTIGDDTHYWKKVADLVLETLAAQKVVPFFLPGNGNGQTYYARWLPVLDGPNDAARLDQLAHAMPPICRAEFHRHVSKTKPIPETPSADLLEGFLKTMCDALFRTWGKSGAPRLTANSEDPLQAWLVALFQEDAAIQASAAQLQALSSGLRAWMRTLQIAGDASFRIALQLISPPAGEVKPEEKKWYLDFFLQSHEDPSLLISAENVWKGNGALKQLGKRIDMPQERMLAGLGYVARMFPPVLASLQGNYPVGIHLDTVQAYSFLREVAPFLQQAGFNLLTPPWWNQNSARLGVRLHLTPSPSAPGIVSSGILSQDNLVNFRWELAIGDSTLSREEFLALASLKLPLIQLRGQWVQLDSEQIEAAIRFWEKQQQAGQMNLIQAAHYSLGGGDSPDALPITDVIAEGWVNDMLSRLKQSERISLLPQPAQFVGTLRPYQQTGFSWLNFFRRWGLGACLADDMGLGKTIQALCMLQHDKENNGRKTKPVLLVCPTSVVTNWQREAQRFTPSLTTLHHQGPTRLRGDEFLQAARNFDVILTSYAILRQDIELIQQISWAGVILDEAQNIKNPSAKQSQAARQVTAGYRLALTGTPLENRILELWSIMQFLNPGFLGSQEHFRREYVLPIERFSDPEATNNLRKLVAPFILRRLKSDPNVISDLPDKMEMKEYCLLTEEQATLYQAAVQNSLQEIENKSGLERRGNVLALLTRLKQICNHPIQYLHQVEAATPSQIAGRSGKLTRLIEMLEEVLAEGDRSLIFTQYAEMGKLLTAYLPHALRHSVLFLHGETPAKSRDQMVYRFQEEEHGPQIFILSLKAGGYGLNLTRANHVFHFDRWWNPAVEDQATDRTYRIGQHQNVLVHKFIITGSLEERIDELIESKKGLSDSIIGGGEQWLTELSTDELRELVALRT
jgi:SNF2 family DNA or RNA helicase